MEDKTKDWQLYEAGKRYNNSLEPSYYATVDANIAFFSGDQWRNIEIENMPKPTFNIIKRVITFFVASLTSASVKIDLEPLLYSDSNPTEEMVAEMEATDIADATISKLFEKFKMPNRIRDALFDTAITGDACAHFIFNPDKKVFGGAYSNIKGELEMELIDGTNVMFGNANNPRVEIQPYIIITGRDMVENLKEEAKRHKKGEPEEIESDYNYENQAGDAGDIEVEADQYGKAFYIIVYRKKKTRRPVVDDMGQPLMDEKGNPVEEEITTVHVSKSVENAYIYKDIDTGLTHYPVAWLNWEKQKNQYHGRAICTGLLPNQIFINRMFAMIMYHLMMTAFPKGIYNADLMDDMSNEIGEAIPVSGLGSDTNINNVASYLRPGDMSNQIVQVIDLAMQYTKETMGISDAALGNIDPKNTSATIAVQKSSAIPLENPKANLYEWIEDIGRILLDMVGTYYGKRPMTIERDGVKEVIVYDYSIFKNMWLNVKADIGEASYWSEISAVETLDNLLQGGYLDIVDYLERIPDEYIPKRQELVDKLKERMEGIQEKEMQYEEMAAFMETLSPEVQAQLQAMPPDQMEMAVMELMAEQEPMMETP